jgi:hypothetical protein
MAITPFQWSSSAGRAAADPQPSDRLAWDDVPPGYGQHPHEAALEGTAHRCRDTLAGDLPDGLPTLDPCPGACFPTGEFGRVEPADGPGRRPPVRGWPGTLRRRPWPRAPGGCRRGRPPDRPGRYRGAGPGSSSLRRQGPRPGSAPSRRSGVERVDELADLLPGSGHGGSRLPATVRTAVGTAVAAAGGGGVRPRLAPRRRRSPAEPRSPGRRDADGRTRRRPRRSRQHPTPLPGPRSASRSGAASRRTIASRSPRETVRGPISKAGRSGLARSDASTGPGNRSGTPVVRLTAC